jgi:hypothetical protein
MRFTASRCKIRWDAYKSRKTSSNQHESRGPCLFVLLKFQVACFQVEECGENVAEKSTRKCTPKIQDGSEIWDGHCDDVRNPTKNDVLKVKSEIGKRSVGKAAFFSAKHEFVHVFSRWKQYNRVRKNDRNSHEHSECGNSARFWINIQQTPCCRFGECEISQKCT